MLGMILAVALAQAAAQPATAAAATAAANTEKPKKICVHEQQIGSHFKRKICATAEEWEKRRERDAAMMDNGGAKAPTKP